MQASVKIMDIDVHMLSNDVFIEKINEYLLEEKLQVIFFASTELLDRAVADEEYRKLVDMAELFLPLLTYHNSCCRQCLCCIIPHLRNRITCLFQFCLGRGRQAGNLTAVSHINL